MAVTALSGQRWQGQLGSAGSAELDGTNDYIDLGGSATTYNFLTAGSFSIACWIKITPAHDKILFDNMNDKTPSTNKGITYIIEGAGGSTYQITMKFSSGSSSSSLVTTAVWGDTDWQHFCSTYDGTTMKIYRNGTEVASGSITSNTEDQSYVPRIGWATDGEKGKLTGNISDFLITNDVLSATEISDLQTTAVSDVSPAISNQQVHYKFTENFNDSSGNSRNATATGSEISTSVYKFPKPDDKTTVTDVPVGSEFEQTDDYKTYQYGGYPNGLGSSADGTIGGGVTTGVTGEISDCFSFGGTSSSNVNLGTDSGFNLLNGGTIAFWLNPNGMVDKRLCGKGSNSCWEILSEGGATEDKIKFRLDTGTNGGTLNNCVGTSTLNDDGTTWYHVCCVYDKDESEMLLYVNGLLETTESITGTIDTVGTALYLGANGSGTSNNFTGLIDDFGVWNTILPIGLANGTTAGSINYLYNKGTGAGGTARVCSTIPTGLLAYYNLDGSTCPNGVAGWIERGTAI